MVATAPEQLGRRHWCAQYLHLGCKSLMAAIDAVMKRKSS